MPLYEHTVIARQDLTGQQAQALTDNFTQVVADQGGTVTKTEYWGLRNLTFRMNKNRKGHYLHFNLDAPAAVLAELERLERLHEDVLRYLSVRVDSLDPNPTVIMQVRSSREERASRRGDGDGRDRDRDRGDRDRGDRDNRRGE